MQRGYHGTRLLTRAEISKAYKDAPVEGLHTRLGRFLSLDIANTGALTYLFCIVVDRADSIDRKPDSKPDRKSDRKPSDSYTGLLDEVLSAVKYSMRGDCPDGLSYAMSHEANFHTPRNKHVKKWLQSLKAVGKRLFVATNSSFTHCNALMTNGFGKEWRSLFDIVICEANKRKLFFNTAREKISTFREENMSRTTKASYFRRSKGGMRGLALEGVFTDGNCRTMTDFMYKGREQRLLVKK